MEAENREVCLGKLTLRRKLTARPVVISKLYKDFNLICSTPDYMTLAMRLSHSSKLIEPNFDYLRDIKWERKFSELADEKEFEYEDGSIFSKPSEIIYLDKIDQAPNMSGRKQLDVQQYYKKAVNTKKKADSKEKYDDFLNKANEFYEYKVSLISNSMKLMEYLEKLRGKWQLPNPNDIFRLLCETDPGSVLRKTTWVYSNRVVCFDNWEIINEDFLPDIHQYMKWAQLAPYSAGDFFLTLCMLFFEGVNNEVADFQFIPMIPQILILESLNTKRVFIEVTPEGTLKELKQLFFLTKEIRENELGRGNKRTKKESIYSLDHRITWEEMHKTMSWDKIAENFRAQLPDLTGEKVRKAVDELY